MRNGFSRFRQVHKMENFDIFISFKNTDDEGRLTEDSKIAELLYKEFCARKVSVFYSNITLLKLGESVYKRSIDKALDTAKILILIGTDLDYIESRWIKYEWESFHTDILNGLKKDGEIITYTRNINAHSLPRALRSYQNCSISDMNINTFCTFAENVLKKLQTAAASSSPSPALQSNAGRADVTQSAVMLAAGKHHKSVYSSTYKNEAYRLKIQAKNSASSDQTALDYIEKHGGFHEHSIVLDAGCAYGYVAEDRFGSAGWVDRILCIDNNRTVIEKARQMHTNPKMLFEVIDLESEDFSEQFRSILDKYGIDKIDVIFSALTLHHLKNPNRVLRRLRKFLAGDGRIILRGSDDGSKLCYPDNDLMNQIIQKSLTAEGVSDRLNGRKLFTQLADSGYRSIRVFSNMKDLSSIDYDDREALFRESFAYRSDYFQKAYEKDPADISRRNDYEWMKAALELFEQQFYERNFWYCEYDYIAVAER